MSYYKGIIFQQSVGYFDNLFTNYSSSIFNSKLSSQDYSCYQNNEYENNFGLTYKYN